MSFVYFALIYNWLTDNITQFSTDVMTRAMQFVCGIALTLVTLWVLIEGYRMVTGRSRESMMDMVIKMLRIAVIVGAATNMSLFSESLQTWFTTDLSQDVNQLINGSSNGSVVTQIDDNLAYTQLAMGAIDGVQTPDANTLQEKFRDSLIATLGIAGPPMTAGALLLMYQVALALFIGLGPIFIMCLIFDKTKHLFDRWLMYGLATLFSLAVLNFMTCLILELTLKVAAELWATTVINTITSQTAEGFTNQAMQQGGIGLLMTVLLISTPPMASTFFTTTIGAFYPNAAVSGGGGWGSNPGPQGQPPGSYGSIPAQRPVQSSAPPDTQGIPPSSRHSNLQASAAKDVIKKDRTGSSGD